jgi:hypothetical protein
MVSRVVSGIFNAKNAKSAKIIAKNIANFELATRGFDVG